MTLDKNPSPPDFKALFNASPNAYVLLNADFTIVEANGSYLRATGRERDEILGRSIFDTFPRNLEDPEDPNVHRLRASFEKVLSTGERDALALPPYATPQETDKGTKHENHYWRATHTPLFDEEGEVAFILQQITDVTELYERGFYEGTLDKESAADSGEEMARQKEGERLRRLFDQAPSFMTFLRGPEHVFEMSNAAYYQVVGHRDILGKPVREALPEVVEQGFPELLDQVFESGEPFVGREVEVRLQKTPGEDLETAYLDFIYQPVTGPEGEVIGIFVQGHDVTEKKKARDRLRQQKGELEELHKQRQLALESAQLGTWDYDFEEDTLHWDERCRSIFGVSEGEKIDFPKAIDIIHPDDQGRVRQAVERSLDPADPESDEYAEEYRVVWPDGTVHWVDARGRVYFEEEGGQRRPVRFIGMVKDITERKQMDEDLRTAREEAEAANRAKSQFLANMSHELRTPLNAVIGYSEMIREDMVEAGADDERQEQLIADLGQIHTAGEQLLNLVNDILDVAKIEAGEMKLHPSTFEVTEMTEDTAETIRPLIEKNGNVFEVDCPKNVGTLHMDKTKLRQALFNLLSNAAKFTEEGTVILRARREEARDGDWFRFAVEDTGIGMTEEEQEEVFETFTQADSSLTREHEGTGLGLTITQNLCQMMGGELELESEKGEGSTFTIRLPAQMERLRGAREPEKDEAPPEETDAQAEPQSTWEAATSSPEAEDVVLVIDDDAQTREIIGRRLEEEGFTVVTASGGEEGLQAARKLRPTAITLDVMMPEMDGWAVLAALQADEELRDIPVVVVTIVEDENMGYMLGASDYLVKPLNAERLVSVLQQYYSDAAGCSVMIVDDDEAMRDLTCRALEEEGCVVRAASNGRAGLQMLEEEPGYRPDVIVLDLMMPEMDGFSFLERVRAHEDFGQIPVVVVTAKELTPRDRERLNGGIVSILQKGKYDREELMDEMYRYVNR